MIDPYPLRLEPLFQSYLWGGRRLQSVLGKKLPDTDGVWAESWEIVDHPEHSSRISNGPLAGKDLRTLAETEPQWLFGAGSPLTSLPLLLKYLDCQRVLSVQVHPDDRYAQQMSPPDLGKTEAWVILDAQPGSVLYAGLKPGTTAEQLKEAIQKGDVEECLHRIEPRAGDCIFIPAGTVHALGAGLLVAEIQQASNTTFRLFDWNRVDKDGRPRPLHVEQALEVIDFEAGPRAVAQPRATDQTGRERLVECEKFVLDRLDSRFAGQSLAGDCGLHLITAPRGGVELSWPAKGEERHETLGSGESRLLPAVMPEVQAQLLDDAFLLDMYLPSP